MGDSSSPRPDTVAEGAVCPVGILYVQHVCLCDSPKTLTTKGERNMERQRLYICDYNVHVIVSIYMFITVGVSPSSPGDVFNVATMILSTV